MSLLLSFCSGRAGKPDWDRPLASVLLLKPLVVFVFVGTGESIQYSVHELSLFSWTQRDQLLGDVLGHLVQQHVLHDVLATQLLAWL